MEEASVAGESPERSKQRGTPEETASESAGPVPGARNGADGAGDPRSAVARGTDGEPSASAGARGGADTGTRVLSVREAEDGTGTDVPAAEDGSGAGPEAASKAGTAAGKPESSAEPETVAASAPDPAEATAPDPEPGAARGGSDGSGGPAREPGSEGSLRDAVAAWVSTADRRTGGNAGRDDADSADGTEDDARGTGDRTDGPGAKPDTDAEAGTKAPPASGGTASARDTGSGPAVAPATGRAPAGGPPAGSAPAKETAADDRDDTDGTPLAADGPADGRNADGGDEGGAGDGPAPATPGNASDGTGDVRLRKAVAAWVSTADKRPAPSDGATADTGEDADADTGTDGEGGSAGTTGSTRTPGAPGPAKGTGPRTDDADDADDADGADDTDADGRDEADDATADAPGTGDRHVDRPTAVFKTLRPSRPSVDQLTTTLKIGDLGRTAGEPGTDGTGPDEPGAGRRPAPGGDRGSRFVALKDDPATQRPSTPPFGPGHSVGPFGAPQAPQRPQGPHGGPTTALPGPGAEHTRQQPMPPKPPLDLLAELTNTPPPPETPLRTTVRRVKIWTPVLVLLVIVFATVQALRPLPQPTLTLTAAAEHTFAGDPVHLDWPDQGQGWMDANGLGTMDHFGEQKPVPIGSVAKTMTAYVVLKEHPLKPGEEGPKIPVDEKAEHEGGRDETDGESTLNTIREGDTLTLRQALSALMIPSANNVARLLGRWSAGSESAFVEKMNDAAKRLGMKNTTYTDPSGLEATTVSTAEDQVKLGNEVVNMPALVEITKLPEWTDPTGTRHRNWNTLVPYDGAIGIKTGTTTKAGGNLLFAATKEVDGETATVVGAILGQWGASNIDVVNAVSKAAMLSAREALTSDTVLKKGAVVGYVDNGMGGRTPVVVTKDVKAIGWSGSKVDLALKPDAVPHGAPAGTKVGTLTVGDGTKGAVKVPVALERDLVEPSFTDKLTRLG
ncbi:D-alanyl-D-alanine carboxypeptidase [Streptomyces sp. SID8352]|nr:D-alanyl-D-alanine carboxypeptidase [Streptomyces sp. SID8352]